MTRTAAVLLAALAAAGCAGAPAAAGTPGPVVLGPAGLATGWLAVPAGAETSVRLVNHGPGAVTFVVRMANGVVLQAGDLVSTADVRFTPTRAVTIVVALQAHAATGASVDCTADGAGGARFDWDLGRAGR